MELRLAFPAVPEAPQATRAALAVLDREVPAPALDDIRLAISEVVTNAVVHGRNDPIRIRVQAAPDSVTVVVEDPGEGFEPMLPPEPGELQESGWGLHFLDRLADRWGVTVGEWTRVWFEIGLGRYRDPDSDPEP